MPQQTQQAPQTKEALLTEQDSNHSGAIMHAIVVQVVSWEVFWEQALFEEGSPNPRFD